MSTKIAQYITPELVAFMRPLVNSPRPLEEVRKNIAEFTTGRSWMRMPGAPLIPLDVADEVIPMFTPFGVIERTLSFSERLENLAGKLVIAILRKDRGLSY